MSDILTTEEFMNIQNSVVINSLITWYNKIISSKYEYIVFTSNQSYYLFNILHKKYNDPIDEKVLLTQSSIQNYYDLFAQLYDNNTYISILLVDTCIIHGIGITNTIYKIFNGIKNSLKEKNISYDEYELNDYITYCIKICAISKRCKQIGLLSSFTNSVNTVLDEDDKRLNLISLVINKLISYDSMSNSIFLFSNKIDEDDFSKVISKEKWLFTETIYNQNLEYANIDFDDNAILSLRIKKMNNEASYSVSPFIILPNLDTNEYEELLDIIENKINNKKYKYVSYDLFKAKKYNDNALSYELITFVLSQAILNEFNLTFNINQNITKEEMEKLEINYNIPNYDVKKAIRELIENPMFENILEIKKILKKVLNNRKPLEYSNNKIYINTKELLEKEFFKIRYLAEKEYIKYYRNTIPITFDSVLCGRDYSETHNAMDVIRHGCQKINKEQSYKYIAYYLQMMDSGIINPVFYPPKKVIDMGYLQYVKAEYQSIFLKSAYMDEYLGVIDIFSYENSGCINEIIKDINRYFKSQNCDLTEEELKKCIDYILELNEIKQRTDNFNFNYNQVNAVFNAENEHSEFIKRYKKKLKHQEHCLSYIDKK